MAVRLRGTRQEPRDTKASEAREVHMALQPTWCPVLQGYVTRVTDSTGWVAAVLCSELDRSHRVCRMKREALRVGAFVTLFPLSPDDAVADLVTRCPMV